MGLMTDTIALSICCTQCGDAQVRPAKTCSDDARVVCPTCKTDLGAWSEVKEQARAAVFDALRDDFASLASAPPAPRLLKAAA